MNQVAGQGRCGRGAVDPEAQGGPDLPFEGPRGDLTRRGIEAAFPVQKSFGPGLQERAHEACLEHELRLAGPWVERQVSLGLNDRGLTIPLAFRMDLVVDDVLVVESKAAEAFTPEHEAQILSYLRFSGKPVGLLRDFEVYPMGRKGIRRIGRQSNPPSAFFAPSE